MAKWAPPARSFEMVKHMEISFEIETISWNKLYYDEQVQRMLQRRVFNWFHSVLFYAFGRYNIFNGT